MLYKKVSVRSIFLFMVIALVVSPLTMAGAREILLPEKGGRVTYDGYESWRYIQNGGDYGGATVSRGGLKNTRRISRTVEHVIAAKQRGLSVSIINHIKTKYDVYVDGPLKGKIARVFKPTIARKEAKATMLGVIKLTVKLKNSIGSPVEQSNSSHTFVTHQTVALTVPRQPFLSRDFVTELIRQILRFDLFEFTHTYRIVPGLPIGGVRVSVPL